MNTKKIIVVAVVAFAIYLVMNDPQGSAGGVQAVVFWFRDAAQSLISFLQNLFR